MIWLVLACRSEPSGPWTPAAALTATATLDGEAALSAEGYARRHYAGPPFASVDHNQDGVLDAAELASLLQQHDPLTFDRTRPMNALNKEKWSQPFSAPALQRATWELLAFLRAEVASVAPDAALPDDDALQAAAATEDLYSDAVQGLLRQLQALHVQHGLTFPSGLLQERPAASP